MSTSRLLDLQQAARYLGVSSWTVRDLEASGVIPRVVIPLPNGRELRKLLFDRADLDRLIDVKALREAFDELVDRMQDIVEASLQKVAVVATEKGLSSDFSLKQPSMWFWKREWENRGKEPGIYFELFGFAPADYSKDVEEYPSMWVMTDEFSRLRMREGSEDFGRAVRAALSPELLGKWSHHEADLSESPLGRDCTEVSESDRVRLVAEPEALRKFIIERIDEFIELVPAIDQALQKMKRR